MTHSGRIDANTGSGEHAGQVELQAGFTTLVTESAEVNAQHQSGVGGSITLLGEWVGLTGEARINASHLAENATGPDDQARCRGMAHWVDGDDDTALFDVANNRNYWRGYLLYA